MAELGQGVVVAGDGQGRAEGRGAVSDSGDFRNRGEKSILWKRKGKGREKERGLWV